MPVEDDQDSLNPGVENKDRLMRFVDTEEDSSFVIRDEFGVILWPPDLMEGGPSEEV